MGGIVTRLAAKQARENGTKVFYTAHGFHFYDGAPKKNWIIYYPIEKYFSNKCDKLITITHEDYRLAKEKFHCQVKHIHGVGVDEKRYFPVEEAEKRRLRQQMGYGENQKILLCVGELLSNKNQKTAVRAMKYIKEKFPDAVLLIAGNGQEKENLEAEIQACGVENNVRMLGYCTHLQDYQHIADVLLSCSYREGLPLNIVEAMLSGTPVVASINRGHKELIQDGKTGFLVNADDSKAMAKKTLKLLEEEILTKEISESARKHATDYSFTVVKQELEEIYFL
jgi:glycosyltransferase EpsD